MNRIRSGALAGLLLAFVLCFAFVALAAVQHHSAWAAVFLAGLGALGRDGHGNVSVSCGGEGHDYGAHGGASH